MFRLGALVIDLDLCRPFGQDSQGNLRADFNSLHGGGPSTTTMFLINSLKRLEIIIQGKDLLRGFFLDRVLMVLQF